MKEIWKDIKGYENLYQVSSFGRVKSLKRILVFLDKNNVEIKRKANKRILNLSICPEGYYFCHICKNGECKNIKVHRLVAENFLENKNNYPCVNHIDGNKLNNNVNNLEWCTYSHNVKEAFRLGFRKPRGKSKNKSKRSL